MSFVLRSLAALCVVLCGSLFPASFVRRRPTW